jgi:hypothetical protein
VLPSVSGSTYHLLRGLSSFSQHFCSLPSSKFLLGFADPSFARILWIFRSLGLVVASNQSQIADHSTVEHESVVHCQIL